MDTQLEQETIPFILIKYTYNLIFRPTISKIWTLIDKHAQNLIVIML